MFGFHNNLFKTLCSLTLKCIKPMTNHINTIDNMNHANNDVNVNNIASNNISNTKNNVGNSSDDTTLTGFQAQSASTQL